MICGIRCRVTKGVQFLVCGHIGRPFVVKSGKKTFCEPFFEGMAQCLDPMDLKIYISVIKHFVTNIKAVYLGAARCKRPI